MIPAVFWCFLNIYLILSNEQEYLSDDESDMELNDPIDIRNNIIQGTRLYAHGNRKDQRQVNQRSPTYVKGRWQSQRIARKGNIIKMKGRITRNLTRERNKDNLDYTENDQNGVSTPKLSRAMRNLQSSFNPDDAKVIKSHNNKSEIYINENDDQSNNQEVKVIYNEGTTNISPAVIEDDQEEEIKTKE